MLINEYLTVKVAELRNFNAMSILAGMRLMASAFSLMVPLSASASGLNLAGINQYARSAVSSDALEQMSSIKQLSDVQPTDWAYQALGNLIERYGCVVG